MSTMQYINYNGKFYEEDTPLFASNNRALKYGDGFFESMVMMQGKMPLLTTHVERIHKSAEILQLEFAIEITAQAIKEMVDELSARNESCENLRVRLQFFRKGEGLYLSKNNKASFILTTEPLKATKFESVEIPEIGLCPLVKKQFDSISSIKTNSALTYVTAAQWAANNNLSDALILNTNNEVCEATSSNIILVIDGKLFTPSISSGCIAGVMRNYLVEALAITEQPITEKDLHAADEIWLTNAVKGIQYVTQYNGSFYKSKKAMETIAFLNTIFGLD
jgi:branched-subunit amino acid aminotransferase/4-amino-4-deoxychorismate lyase